MFEASLIWLITGLRVHVDNTKKWEGWQLTSARLLAFPMSQMLIVEVKGSAKVGEVSQETEERSTTQFAEIAENASDRWNLEQRLMLQLISVKLNSRDRFKGVGVFHYHGRERSCERQESRNSDVDSCRDTWLMRFIATNFLSPAMTHSGSDEKFFFYCLISNPAVRPILLSIPEKWHNKAFFSEFSLDFVGAFCLPLCQVTLVDPKALPSSLFPWTHRHFIEDSFLLSHIFLAFAQKICPLGWKKPF